jgi:hypothetical protein
VEAEGCGRAEAAARALARLGFDAVSVPRRGRYFGFRGSGAEQKQLRAAIAHLIQSYPRRVDVAPTA